MLVILLLAVVILLIRVEYSTLRTPHSPSPRTLPAEPNPVAVQTVFPTSSQSIPLSGEASVTWAGGARATSSTDQIGNSPSAQSHSAPVSEPRMSDWEQRSPASNRDDTPAFTLPERPSAAENQATVDKPPLWKRIVSELRPRRLLVSLTAGMVAGLMAVVLQISFAALIFSGDLSQFIADGIGLMLFSALLISLVVTASSSFSGVVAMPQGGTSAILATIATAITVQMPSEAPAEEIYITVLAAMALTSLLTGVFFVLLGLFRLGNLVRFLPYPVVGGFLAGTGWLLVRGGVKTMSQVPLEIASLSELVQPQVLMLWAPGVVFALLVTAVVRWRNHFLIIPSSILLVLIIFYSITSSLGYGIAELTAAQWLFEPFPSGAMWRPLALDQIELVNWNVVFSQVGSVGTVMIISVVSLLLRSSGIELTTKEDLELNRELLASGGANLLVGLFGGVLGYPSLSLSVLGSRLGANSRVIGLVTSIICAVLLFIGAPILSLFPKLLLGGLVVYLGFGFLIRWLYEAWFELQFYDYAIVVLIMVVINSIGILEGIGLGILLTVIMFAIDYSRIRVVKHELSGKNYSSRVDRSRIERKLLQNYGDDMYILELQGFIFFGTANSLQEQLKERFASPDLPTPRCVVLDFRQVIGIDASAVLSFNKLQQITYREKVHLVLTALSDDVRDILEQGTADENETWHIFESLDYGVEWCEEQILNELREEIGSGLEQLQTSVFEQMTVDLTRVGVSDKGQATRIGQSAKLKIARLAPYLILQEVPADTYLIRQGDPPTGIYFVGSGQITALRERDDQPPIRLRTMGTGTVVGEVGYYLGRDAVASIVTDELSTIYYLSGENLTKMREDNPKTAVAFNEFIAQLLAERLSDTIGTVEALKR